MYIMPVHDFNVGPEVKKVASTAGVSVFHYQQESGQVKLVFFATHCVGCVQLIYTMSMVQSLKVLFHIPLGGRHHLDPF